MPLIIEQLQNLLLPVQCPGCGQVDTNICPACLHWAKLGAGWHAASLSAWQQDTQVWALGQYQGAGRRLILAAKHNRFRDLRPWIGQQGAWGGMHLPPQWAKWQELDFVIVPSRHRSRRYLNLCFAKSLARASLAQGQVKQTQVISALAFRRNSSGQAGLGAKERARNLQGQIQVRVCPRNRVVVVDDVATTGATLDQCVTQLEQAGATVVGAIVLAAVRATPAIICEAPPRQVRL